MVKRYEDFSPHVDYMEKDSDGTWVKYEDYKKLQQECEALKAENERLSKELEGVRYCALWDKTDIIETAARAVEAYLSSQEVMGCVAEHGKKSTIEKIRKGEIEL